MKNFTELFTNLDQTTKTLVKIDALLEYFEKAPDQDKLWAIAILSHRRPKRTVNMNYIKMWAAEFSGLPYWLFEESYHVVGDIAEAISLILPEQQKHTDHSLTYWIEFIRSLGNMDEAAKKEHLREAWLSLSAAECFVFNKLITGGFRMGVSQKLMVRALSKHTGVEENILAHRLMGHWSPDDTTFEDLILSAERENDDSRPYPFYLAYAVEEPKEIGLPEEWLAERKWDGIRGQVIVRNGHLYVWSRGEELVTDKYPEYEVFRHQLPDGTVLDGEILPFKEGQPLPFNLLQTRIGRKNLSPGVLKKAPVVFKVYDLLEWRGQDIRKWPMHKRRAQLEQLVASAQTGGVLQLSEIVPFDTWEELATEREKSREYFSEGFMLKRRDSVYRSGRKRGDWWKWKVEPLTVDAVMIYAMRGHGRRANLYTDYTFAVWEGEHLVPFTKAYSGLTDDEIREVDRFVKKNTIDRFGPVRSVTPELVFEIAFEGISRSTRHKSGVALRFPRIKRWRKDKVSEEANTLDDLQELLEVYGSGGE